MKRLCAAALALLWLPALLLGCGNKTAGETSVPTETDATALTAMTETFSATDLEVGYDESSAVTVTCSGSQVSVDGSGVTAENGQVSITGGGSFVLSGALNGQVCVDAKDEEIHLILKGIDITSSDGPAVYVKKASKVIVTLEADTVNSLTDSQTYTLAPGEDEPNACLYSKSDLTINGQGSLSVTGNYNHGIYCKDALSITDGNLSVTSVNDGLKGKDSVQILTCSLAIQAGGDGIQSNNGEDAALGYVSIAGGSYTIDAGGDGIQAETALQIKGGSFQIQSGTAGGEESGKGLKGGAALNVSGGSFRLNCTDDALHTNGDLSITGGEFTIASSDDGVHADGAVTIAGGSIHITESYEGIEGLSVTVTGGEIVLTASDDGVNAADGSGGDFPMGFGHMGASSDCFIRISGGSLEINAVGDGVDSNGALYVDGGTLLVGGFTGSGDSALDYENTAEITGGTVIAAGSAGMAAGFTDGSTQYSFLVSFQTAMPGGTELIVTDSSGAEICRYTPQGNYQSIVVSTPQLKNGETYTVTAGQESLQVTLTQIATNSGGMGGGFGNKGGGFGGRGDGGRFPGGMEDTPPDGANQPGGGRMPPDGMTPPTDENGDQNMTPPEAPAEPGKNV